MKTIYFSALLLGTTLSSLLLPAAAHAAQARIPKNISDDSRTILPASSIPWANKTHDLGQVPSEMSVPGITLVFSRSAAQEADLQSLLSAQQNPKSPLYHQWLTPEAFASRFGMGSDDIAQTESWLTAHGFHIDNVARSRDRITFSGTAAQVQQAFGTSLHYYQLEGATHFAPSSALSLPSSLAAVTTTVLHLSNLRPKPGVHAITQPMFTSAANQAHYLGPDDLWSMYDLWDMKSNNINGEGQSIAIVGQSHVDTSSVQVFQESLLTTSSFIFPLLVPSSGVEEVSLGDEGESQIDLEYASAFGRGAVLYMVYVGNNQNYSVFDSLSLAITDDIAPVVSISYGSCEPLMSSADLDQYNSLFEEASAQGQTIVASTGDSGSTACAPYTTAEGVSVAEQESIAVNFPASSPYVTAVGGTQMAAGTFAAGNTTYWDAATSVDIGASLLSYVSETAWNEGSASLGIVAGGGGTSSHYPRPSWQSSFPGMPAGSFRLLPDIALQSSIYSPGYLICSSDPSLLAEEGQSTSCTSGLKGSNGAYTLAGGTSFAAPVFAGYLSILNEYEHATGQGNINPMLYQLASDTSIYATAFHDITSGSIACVTGASGCIAADQSSYAATTGYDEATGLGSLDLEVFSQNWPVAPTVSLSSTVVTVEAINSASPGDSVPIYSSVQPVIDVNNQVPSPTGSFSISLDGTVLNPNLPINTYSYSITAPSGIGSHLISVTYSGDAAHSPSTGTAVLNVGDLLASGTISLTATNISLANNGSGTSTITITPAGGYGGRLTWGLSVTSASPNAAELTGCYGIPFVAIDGVTTTTLKIGIGTACTSSSSDAHAALRAFVVHRLTGSNKQPAGLEHDALWTGASLCMVFCACLGRRRRNWPLALLLLTLLPLAGLGLGGCGGGGSTTSSSGSGSSGSGSSSSTSTYTVTLVGTDSVNEAITASTTFTLTVE